MSGPYDTISPIGPLGRVNSTVQQDLHPADHDTTATQLDLLLAAGQALQLLPAMKSANLSDLADLAAAARRLGREHRSEAIPGPSTQTHYGHSYGGGVNPNLPASYVSSIRAYFHARLAARHGLPLLPPYYYNRHSPGQRLSQTVGIANSTGGGIGGLDWSWKIGQASGLVTLAAMRNDTQLFNTAGADTTAWQETLRVFLRILRSQSRIVDTAMTKVGTWNRAVDTTMASGGGWQQNSTGDVTTDYLSFPCPGTDFSVVMPRADGALTPTVAVIRMTDHTNGDATLADVPLTGGFPAGGTGPAYSLISQRIQGIAAGHEIRVGRKPGTTGTVTVDEALIPYTGDGPPVLPIVVKDPPLVSFGSAVYGYPNLAAAIDTVVAEAEFSAWVTSADPTKYGWDGRLYSATVENSGNGRNGCVADDGTLLHPNDHGQFVICDSIEAAEALAAWTRALGAFL